MPIFSPSMYWQKKHFSRSLRKCQFDYFIGEQDQMLPITKQTGEQKLIVQLAKNLILKWMQRK